MNTAAPNSVSAFQLKGSLLTFTVLQLLHAERQAFTSQLALLAQQSANFFKNAPIIIDLEKLADTSSTIDFHHIRAELLKHGLIPVGVRNATEEQGRAAASAGLGVLSGKAEAGKPTNKNNASKIISQPVRSGQQIYAQGTDLIVLAPVSYGAELIADGNIHVYGPLRGRASAGAAGDTNARIFCQKLEAELVAIAGFYQLSENIKPIKSGYGIQVYLEREKLQVAAISVKAED